MLYKTMIAIFLAALFQTGASFSQEKPDNQPTNTIAGSVTKVDTVGNVISVQTDQGPMSFSVPEGAKKLHETHDIGLLDIKEGHPVSIQYKGTTPDKYTVVSIVDNYSGIQ